MKFVHNIKKTIIVSIYLASVNYVSSNEDEEISNGESRKTLQEPVLQKKQPRQAIINIFFKKKDNSTLVTSPSSTRISVGSTKNLAGSSTTSSSQRYDEEESEGKEGRDKPVSATHGKLKPQALGGNKRKRKKIERLTSSSLSSTSPTSSSQRYDEEESEEKEGRDKPASATHGKLKSQALGGNKRKRKKIERLTSSSLSSTSPTSSSQRYDEEESEEKEGRDKLVSATHGKLKSQALGSNKRKRKKIEPLISSSLSSTSSTLTALDRPELEGQEEEEIEDPTSKNKEEEESPEEAEEQPDAEEEIDILESRRALRDVAEAGISNTDLNIYLLKQVSTSQESKKIFEDIFKNVTEKRKKHFKDFPWVYLNSTKHSSVLSPHTGDDFIDAQIYLDIENGAGETIYIFQEVGIRKPNWSKIFYDQIEKHRESEKSLNKWFEVAEFNKEAKGALVIIKKEIDEEERYFAITFGWTGRFLLNLDYCDNNFGKHYAYNLLSSNPDYKAQSFAEVNLNEKKLKSEQAKLNGRVNVLRGIRAFIPKSLVVTDGTRRICSFTGSHITVKTKFAFETIGDRCKDFFQIAQKEDYKKDYKHIDDFRSLEQEEEIDEILINAFENCYFEAPFDVERITGTQSLQDLRLKYQRKGNLSKNFPKLKPNYHDFFHLAEDLKEFVMSSKINSLDKVDRLRKLKIIAFNDSSHQVASWNAHQLITATVDYRNTTYWIEGGEVFEVNENFVKWINLTLDKCYKEQKIPSNSGIYKLLKTPFTDSHTQNRKNKKTGKVYKVLSEGVYNKSVADNNPEEFILFDAKLIPVKGDANTHSTVEPCDLFSNIGELIHLKRWENSSTGISYLATQAMSSAYLLIHHQDFHNCFIKKLADKNFQEARQKVIEKKFRVVLGYIHPEQVSPSGLPFNAKMQLLKGIEEIQSLGLKFNIISIRDDSSSKQGSSSSSSSSTPSTVPYTQQSSFDFVEDREDLESGLEGTALTGEVDFDEGVGPRFEEDEGEIPWASLAAQNEIKDKNEEDEIDIIVNQFYSGELPKSMQGGRYKQLLENYKNIYQEFESLRCQLCEIYELDEDIEPKDLLEKIKNFFDDFDPEKSEPHEENYRDLSQLYKKIEKLEGEIYKFCSDQLQNQRNKSSSRKGKEKDV